MFLKFMLKMKITTPRILPQFPTISEMFPVPIEHDVIMVSFDATSLYTNIPIIDRLNIIQDYVNNDDQFTRKTALSQDTFVDLAHLVLKTIWYTLYSQFYQQTDDAAMGGPASSIKTEIYMQAYERTAIPMPLHPPKVWE